MYDQTTIHVNFARPMPVFPLNVAVLMPHAVAPLEIFEPRYRQMTSDALDGPGLIAMAVFEAGEKWKSEYHARPAIRPAVCVGHIAEHFKWPDGRYAIVLQGVCRGRVVHELAAGESKLYREAMIEPVGMGKEDDEQLETYRERFCTSLADGPLTDLRLAKDAARHLKNSQIPTSVIIEFLGANLPESHADLEARYQWLAADDAGERARIVSKRLDGLATLLRKAAPQRMVETPKGCHWN